MVDIKKVFDALIWLKKNNPLYSEINLTDSSSLLLDQKFQDVEFQVQEEDIEELNQSKIEVDNEVENLTNKTVDDNKNKGKVENGRRAFLTQMSESSEYYEQFTIHPMYSAKEIKTDTELYQMLKIEDLALPNYYKFLD